MMMFERAVIDHRLAPFAAQPRASSMSLHIERAAQSSIDSTAQTKRATAAVGKSYDLLNSIWRVTAV